MSRSTRVSVLCLFLGTLFWSFAGVFVKHLSLQAIDADVQNLYRYAAGTMSLWILVFYLFGRGALTTLKRTHTFLLPTTILCVFQVVMVSSLYKKSIYPGFSSLLSKSSVLFGAILAFILFRDERKTILSWRYLVGGLLGMIGVVGVVMFGETARAEFSEGVFLVILSAFLWACYTLSMKPVLRHTHPIIAFAVISTFTTLFFLVLASARSRPMQFFTEVSVRDQVLIVLSGLLCIGAAHSLYFRAVSDLGVAVCSSFLLVQPLITGTLSAIALGERLRPGQILMGGVLLAGVYLSTVAGQRARRTPEAVPLQEET